VATRHWLRDGVLTGLTCAAASALIWLLDYKIVPERRRPGFEERLGPEAIAATYVLLALSLALSPLWKRTEGGPQQS
jgi:hypothetical protein